MACFNAFAVQTEILDIHIAVFIPNDHRRPSLGSR